MLNCLILGVLVPNPQEKNDDTKKLHRNLVKKLRVDHELVNLLKMAIPNKSFFQFSNAYSYLEACVVLFLFQTVLV